MPQTAAQSTRRSVKKRAARSVSREMIRNLEARVSASKQSEEEATKKADEFKATLENIAQENERLRKLSKEIMLDHNLNVNFIQSTRFLERISKHSPFVLSERIFG